MEKIKLINLRKLLTAEGLRKVLEITVFFWIIKLLTTAMGESTSDYLVHQIDPVIAVILGALGFGIAFALQFWTRKYVAWVYWLAVTMVAIFGTMAADVVHIVLGVPYWLSTISFAIALTVIFFIWHKTEQTLSIHSILTPRREIFYWLAVITTFAFGTAAGDMTAITFKLGYLASGILFAVLFGIPLVAYKFLGANEVVTFWVAYIFTRPSVPHLPIGLAELPTLGGIEFATGGTKVVLPLFIISFVLNLPLPIRILRINDS